MSTKNRFFSSRRFFSNPTQLAIIAIIFSVPAVAVSQQPLPEPPLVGGFKIDFGDGDQTPGASPKKSELRDYRSADEVVRSLMEAEKTLESEAQTPVKAAVKTPVKTPVKTAVEPPKESVPGLPRAALPMAFPASSPQSGPAKGPATLIQAGDMIGFSRELGDGVQAITIINASRRWMAVYHIDTSGQIRLTSSRPLDADFTIQFNAAAPLPEDIRRLQGK